MTKIYDDFEQEMKVFDWLLSKGFAVPEAAFILDTALHNHSLIISIYQYFNATWETQQDKGCSYAVEEGKIEESC